MKKYTVVLSVDNNRYGVYFRKYATRAFYNVEAESRRHAYYIAADKLKKEKRYKNCIVEGFDNQGHHDTSTWSINCHAVKEV